METHISAVFVGTDTAWKLKKAVRLPFLDFTSLSARRHFLQRELALNQPAAPEIYRDVAAASELGAAPGALVLRSENEIRKRLHGVSPEDRLPEIAYLNHANAAVADVLVAQARSVAADDHTVILDATFLDPGLRRRVAAAMEITKVRFIGISLHAPLSVLEAQGTTRATLMHLTPQLQFSAVHRQKILATWIGWLLKLPANAALAALRRAVANKR